MHIFQKIALITKKCPLKVTSNNFLFREVEQLAVYQFEVISCYLIVTV